MGALVPLILAAVPAIAPYLGLDWVLKKGGDLVESITGTRDPIAAASVLQDPAKAAELQLGLARLTTEAETERRRIELQTLQANLTDTQSARALSGSSPLIARTQVSLAACLVTMVVAVIVFLGFRDVPFNNRDLFNIVLGALIVEFRGVMGFFFGGSTSGHSANNVLAQAFQRITGRSNAPAAVATTGDVTVQTTEDLNRESLLRSRAP